MKKKSKTEEMLNDIIPETRSKKRKAKKVNAKKANSSKIKKSKSKSSRVRVNFELAAKKALALKKEIISNKIVEHKVENKTENKILSFDFKSTAEIPVSKQMISQVIGQEKGVEIIKKAAIQKRNILLVGLPGTGKSMLAQAMAEIMPVSKLHDILVYPNYQDPNNPRIRVVDSGKGKEILAQAKTESKAEEDNLNFLAFLLPFGFFILATVMYLYFGMHVIIYAACLLLGGIMLIAFSVSSQMKMRSGKMTPKLLIDNAEKKMAPFLEATGARAGALLGDVRHDPLQSLIDEVSFIVCRNGVEKKLSFKQLWRIMSKKYSGLIEKHPNGYEAIVFPKKEAVFTYGLNNKKEIVLSRIYSMNRRPYTGKVIEISAGKSKVTLTPEHKVFTQFKTKEVAKLNFFDRLLKLEI